MAMLTGVNPRTVRNRLQSDNGPNGAGLVVLMRHSEQVTTAELALVNARLTVLRLQKLHRRVLDAVASNEHGAHAEQASSFSIARASVRPGYRPAAKVALARQLLFA